MKRTALASIAGCLALAGCASSPSSPTPPTPVAPPPPPAHPAPPAPVAEPAPAPATAPAPSVEPVVAPAPKEVFPNVYFDAARRAVSFGATVPIDPGSKATPIVYLEVLACVPDTKEHETLVVTTAKASHIHAALLLAGFEAGKPGAYDWTGPELKTIPPKGSPLNVRFIVVRDGVESAEDPATWVKSLRTEKSLRDTSARAGFVFGGSLEGKRAGRVVYDADFSGTLIGLTTFGTETIAWSEMYNHDAGVEDPQWVADEAVVPPPGTAVRVEITHLPQ